MNHIIPFLVSLIEWIALLSLPIVFLGYYYRKYFKAIILLAFMMSLFSLLLRITPIHVAMIIGIQIFVLLILVKLFFKVNFTQAYVITSMGYGLYNFVQMLIIEIVVQALEFPYFQIYFSIHTTATIQIFTAVLMLGLCYGVHRMKFELSELRYLIQDRSISKKYRNILVVHSTLMFGLICLTTFILLSEDFRFKFLSITVTLILIFIMVLGYVFIHNQFQLKRLTEAKKFYLDQEQQVAKIVKKLSEDYHVHFKAISKLGESHSSELIKKYMEENQLTPEPSATKMEMNFRTGLDSLDELLYALIINKRKVASFLNVSIEVTADIKHDVQISLHHVRNLSIIFDDLILLLYPLPDIQDKKITMHIETSDEEIVYTISSSIDITEEQSAELQLFDALLRMKKNNAKTQFELKPVSIRIHCPLINKEWFDVI